MFERRGVDFDAAGYGKVRTGDEASSGDSVSSSTEDLRLLGVKGEPGGVPIWAPSPKEADRLVLAAELAVGFMYECWGLCLGLSQGSGDWDDCGDPEEWEEKHEERLGEASFRKSCLLCLWCNSLWSLEGTGEGSAGIRQ